MKFDVSCLMASFEFAHLFYLQLGYIMLINNHSYVCDIQIHLNSCIVFFQILSHQHWYYLMKVWNKYRLYGGAIYEFFCFLLFFIQISNHLVNLNTWRHLVLLPPPCIIGFMWNSTFTVFHYMHPQNHFSQVCMAWIQNRDFLHFADLSPEEAEDVSFKQVDLQPCELCNSSTIITKHDLWDLR